MTLYRSIFRFRQSVAVSLLVAHVVGGLSCGGELPTATTSGGTGGEGGKGGAPSTLDAILAELRTDVPATMQKYADLAGWPIKLEQGYLFVSTDITLALVSGDHDNWMGTSMTVEQNFAWVLLPVKEGNRYKFTNESDYQADPWARSYTYDQFGEISLVSPIDAHIDRWTRIGNSVLEERSLRVWVPTEPIGRVLYVHDGQNLFDPDAFFGGWHLQDNAPPDALLVGIDNTSSRMDEYTHVPDEVNGQTLGGKGDQYAEFLKTVVRPLIRDRYGENGPIGVMGSSLGGLISFHIADKNHEDYTFAASLSGTMGWGSIGSNSHFETMIERYSLHGHRSVVLYLDSGGSGVSCQDSDADGVNDDDPEASDNFCETEQLFNTLLQVGYKTDGTNQDLHYWWEPDAQHNEAAWASRVWRPLQIFGSL